MPSLHDVDQQAASLAFALLRFEDRAAHPSLGSTPPGMLRVGIDCYLFTPSWKRIPCSDVAAYLAQLPSPALLSPTTTRGIVSLTLVDELSGDRRAWAQKSFDNQLGGLQSMATQLGLTDDSNVLLQFDDEEHLFSLPVLRTWCARFGVHVGWGITAYTDDSRARARLMLTRSDGARSWGDACRVRGPHGV